jgi:PAS domain S-box-containing protein
VILHPDRPNYTIAAANTAFLDATYTQLKALSGRKFFDAFPINSDDDGRRTRDIYAAFAHVLDHKQPYVIRYHRYDLSELDDDRDSRYWNIETYPLLNESGEIQFIIQSSTDVTAHYHAENQLQENHIMISRELEERKRIEEKLRVSNERYDYVNKATNDVIYEWNILTAQVHWGEAFTRLFNYADEENFPLSRWLAMIHPDDFTALESSLGSALANTSQNNWTFSYRMKRADDTYAFVEENGYILRDDQGYAIRMIGVVRDSTERERARSEIESLKNTYSDLFHLSPLPMWVYDLESLKFLDVNKAALAHYGYSSTEFLSMSILDIRPKEDAATLIRQIKNEVRQGIYHSSDVRHKKKSGEIILVNTKGNSIHYGQREVRLVVAIDITERIRAQQALMDSERRFKTLIQEGSDIIAITDLNGQYTYVSPNIKRILGLSPKELLGKDASGFVYEGDREAFKQQISLLDNKKQHVIAGFRYIDPAGKTYWIESVITDLREDLSIAGIVSNSRVVTERVENEIKIKEHLDRYNIVSKATSDAIWDVDMQSGKLLWNHGISAMFGHEVKEYEYDWWFKHVHPDDVQRVKKIVDANIRKKLPRWTSEYRFQCADGTYKYVLDRGFLIFDENNGHPIRMIGALQDITERVKHTKAIEARNAQLTEIAWTQSHLVRAPLANILALLQLLDDDTVDRIDKRTMMTYLYESAVDLDAIIKEIVAKSENAANQDGL